MTVLNELKIKEELLNLIRNSDLISVSDRNATTATYTATGSSSQASMTLDNAGVTNIRSVTIAGTLLTLYRDYDINIYGKTATESKLITLTTPLSGGESISIVYDYNSNSTLTGERVWGEYSQNFITPNTIPRIGFELVSITNRNRSANDTLQQKNILFDFFIVSYNDTIDTLKQSFYTVIFDNRKNLYWLNLLRPSGSTSKKLLPEYKNQLIYNRFFTFTAPTEFER